MLFSPTGVCDEHFQSNLRSQSVIRQTYWIRRGRESDPIFMAKVFHKHTGRRLFRFVTLDCHPMRKKY